MPYTRKKTFNITLDEADKLLLETLTKRRKITQKELIGYYIQVDTEHDIYNANWKARLEGVKEDRNRYAGLEGSCTNMTFAKKNYICVRANLGKPPTIKALSEELDEAHKICGICEVDTSKKIEHDETLERVRVLEKQLSERSTEKYKVPTCTYGAYLDADGLSFNGCRLNPGKTVSAQEYCKVRMTGKPCNAFVERVVGVGKKI